MKKVIYCICLFVFLFINYAHGQKHFRRSFSSNKISTINIRIPLADTIIIDSWKFDSIVIEGSVNINQNSENDSLLLETRLRNTEISISTDLQIQKTAIDNPIAGPRIKTAISWLIKIPEKNISVNTSTHTAYIWIKGNTKDMIINNTSGNTFLDTVYKRNVTLSLRSFHGRVLSKKATLPSTSSSQKFILGNGDNRINIYTVGGDILF